MYRGFSILCMVGLLLAGCRVEVSYRGYVLFIPDGWKKVSCAYTISGTFTRCYARYDPSTDCVFLLSNIVDEDGLSLEWTRFCNEATLPKKFLQKWT